MSFSYLEPSCIEDELEESKDWNIEIQVMAGITLGGIQKLPSNQAGNKKGVDSQSDYLGKRKSQVRT